VQHRVNQRQRRRDSKKKDWLAHAVSPSAELNLLALPPRPHRP
jgi:hypothetical protein